jgi:hypothetical protein
MPEYIKGIRMVATSGGPRGYLREHRAGDFIAAINRTRTSDAETVIMTIGAFAHEPEALYVALD